MKKEMLLASVMISAVMLAGCGKQNAGNQPVGNAGNGDAQKETAKEGGSDNGTFSGNTSLKDLLGMGKDMECSWSSKDSKGEAVSGKVSISGSKFRTVMSGSDPKTGQSTNFNSLSDGEWVYTWTDANKNEGIKMKLSSIEEPSAKEKGDVSSDVAGPGNGASGEESAMNDDYDYDCKPWTPSGTDFSVPSDVKFADLSEMMKGFQADMPVQQPGN